MSILREGMKPEHLLEAARDDFIAAANTRRTIEARKQRDYELYRRHRDDVDQTEGEHGRGPFGWSSLTVPIAFWTVETILPRLATHMPKLITRPLTPAAVPLARAKELRLQQQLKRAGADIQLFMALKQTSMLGDGPVKVTWDAVYHRPKVTSIYWMDFFCSSEAQTFESAEVLYHRTWWTRRQLARLSREVDADGQLKYANLDEVWLGADERNAADPTYTSMRDAAGLGSQEWSPHGGQVPLLECWYDDGSLVVLGGSGYDVLVRAAESPFKDADGRLVRPFVFFRNSPDTVGPYAISDVEVVEDAQEEVSTIRNQAIDQITANVNAPIAHDATIPPELVDAAFGAPGGKLPVQGDVRSAVMRVPPGQVSTDVYEMTEMIRGEAQLATGINDYATGQTSASGISNQTATGIELITREANQRLDMKRRLTEIAMAELGRHVDMRDRQFGAESVHVPIPKGLPLPEGEGITPVQGGGMVSVDATVNAADALFDIEVEAGSATPPSEREQAQNTMAWVAAISSNPAMAMAVNWAAVAREVTQAFGFDPDRLLLSEEQQLMQQVMQQAPMDPMTGEPAQPVGEPELVS